MTAIEQCGCLCHMTDEKMYHVMPCCMVCPDCGATVNFGAFAAHERTHAPKCPEQMTAEELAGE